LKSEQQDFHEKEKVMRTLSVATVLIVSLAVVAAIAGPERGSIEGRIIDGANGTGVAGAWVAIVENNIGTRTDSTGWFEILDLSSGTYNLIITHPDYGTVTGLSEFRAMVKAGVSVTLTITISRTEEKPNIDFSELEHATTTYKQGIRDEARVQVNGIVSTDEVLAPSSGGNLAAPERPQPVCPPYPGRKKDKHWQYHEVPPQDMFFRDYGTSGFVQTRHDRFSTFAVDTDDASYALVRRYLLDGLQPPTASIRVEEFVNHFDYGYNPPSDRKFRVFTELTESPFERGRGYLKIGIKGREIDRRDRKPLNLTLVIDVSGSMRRENRLGLVKDALRMLVGQLDRNDRVGMVAYGSSAWTVLEPTRTDRSGTILRAIDALSAGGSTFAEAGLREGYRMANNQFVNGHNNVVVLCSDGVANVGHTSPDAIMGEIERFARRGITLNTFGFGMGNYNDVLLEQLAIKGDGRYAYVDDRQEAQRLFADDLVGSMQLLARDVKIQVEFDPKVVKSYRLLGYENRDVPDHQFRDNQQDGGEVGVGHEVTALYELEFANRRRDARVATVFVRWKNPDETEVSEVKEEAVLRKHWQKPERARAELKLAIVAARFGGMLKNTAYASETSFQELARLAQDVDRQLHTEQTRELLDLISRAGSLSGYHANWQAEEMDDDINYRQ